MDGQDQATYEPMPTQATLPIPQLLSPNPEADKGIILQPSSNIDGGEAGNVVVSDILPMDALMLLSTRLEALARVTGDIPSTPPYLTDPAKKTLGPGGENEPSSIEFTQACIDEGGESADSTQQDALARRFFSKTAPGVSIEEYLLRLQKFCPMSTAIYLAASRYINKLAVVEKIIPVTPRSVHRLSLASLRVAMKALEDLSYPHERFAMVGGVTKDELRKLEVGFCFLTDFDLVVDADTLLQEVMSLREGKESTVSS